MEESLDINDNSTLEEKKVCNKIVIVEEKNNGLKKFINGKVLKVNVIKNNISVLTMNIGT